jgi:ComF family protein
MAPFHRNENNTDGPLCGQCERLRPPFVRAVAYGVYEDTLRALVHLLKYERTAPLAVPLGALLAQAIHAMPGLPQELAVVAVPLHPAKERQRGFNQSALLAKGAVRALGRLDKTRRAHLVPRALGRQRATEGQAGLTPHQRRRNLRGAFFVARPEAVRGRAVLLLDDIYTTGATARECTRALLAAGAASVYVATLARSQRESAALWDAPPQWTAQMENAVH